MTMKLYDLELSGNCYRVRLFLSMLRLPHELRTVNLMKGEQREAWYLALNPRGQVPVLDDNGTIVWDSLAILVYLARQYGGEQWLPLDAKGMAEVMQWLAVMENETLYGLGKARIICKFKRPGNLEEAQALGRKGLDVLEQRLAAHPWLALDRLTIADIGCLPYVALAPEGEIDLAGYPNVRHWLERMKAQPGYVTMPGMSS
ncbi:MAG TPA: glutathione S-transferase family protein [Casimicrobiaceae bacterium]|nr:glutathione S-transferase family protein [Casimicrobiaceae bacterium]